MSICSNRAECKPAQLCYYDLLDAETAASVPDDVREHVASCADCQADVDRLRDLLASAAKKPDTEQSRRDSAIVELLSLHFALVDELVTCTEVRPFLPGLADPLLRVRIPTPITVHIENCPACFKELKALTDANLTHRQLCRLSRILADDLDADAEIAEVRAAFPPTVEMLARADSGIATRFSFGEPADADSGDLEATRPIKVDVIDRQQTAAANWQRQVLRNLKQYRRSVMASAAVLLVGLALFLATPTIGAVDVGYVLNFLNGADNIHATYFEAGRTEPERERWVSKPLKKYMVKVGEELTLWDLREGSKTVKKSQGAPPEAASFTPTELARAKSMLDNAQGIAPCKSRSDSPPDAKWGPTTDVASQPGTRQFEVYDLTWTDRTARPAVMRKWRVFMDPATHRPEKVEYYSKLPAEAAYTPRYEYELEYLSDAEMRAAIEQVFP